MYKAPGDCIEAFHGANQAIGLVFLRFPNEESLCDIVENIQDNIRVIVCNSNAQDRDFEFLRSTFH